MTCAACLTFETNRKTGAFQKGCAECDARHLAIGQPFWESMRRGNITDGYRRLLDILGGKEWEKLHQNVKRVAGLIRGEVV